MGWGTINNKWFLTPLSPLSPARITHLIFREHRYTPYTHTAPKMCIPQTPAVHGPVIAVRWRHGEGGVNVGPMCGIPLWHIQILQVISRFHLCLLLSYSFNGKVILDSFLPIILTWKFENEMIHFLLHSSWQYRNSKDGHRHIIDSTNEYGEF